MKFAIMGSGGVGGYFGGRLAKVGNEVTFIARGPHLEAMRANGLKVESTKGNFELASVTATDNPADVGPVDVVIMATKAYGLAAAAEAVRPMVGDATTVLPLLNGVDIAERLGAVLGTEKILPGLCGLSTFIAEPGVIHHVSPFEYVKFGEAAGGFSERGKAIEAAMVEAGINAVCSEDFKIDLWTKFIMLASVAGVCSVSRAPFGPVRNDPDLRAMLAGQIGEIESLAQAAKVGLPSDIAERTLAQIDAAPEIMKPSMLMDLEAGKPLELEVLQGAILTMGTQHNVDTPVARFIHAALKFHANGPPNA